MKLAKTWLLVLNGGSSSIKFALVECQPALTTIMSGKLDTAQARLVIRENNNPVKETVIAAEQGDPREILLNWLKENIAPEKLLAVGHRIVHGGEHYYQTQFINTALTQALRKLSPLDPQHLPGELGLVDAVAELFPTTPQVACFDTEFHWTMPIVAKQLPIPRRYWDKGIRRFGFHGLSCEYLMYELNKLVGDRKSLLRRVIIAHIGGGVSVTAVRDGKSIDTSMAFTPCSGLPMSTRSGDLDPGLCGYFADTEQITAQQFQHMVNHQSGLLGISETSGDIRELLEQQAEDSRAAEAVDLFCYRIKKAICGLCGALGGLDTLVFSGGIGENLGAIRERICADLEFLGVHLNLEQNSANAEIISSRNNSTVMVRVIKTDEEWMIAQKVHQLLQPEE